MMMKMTVTFNYMHEYRIMKTRCVIERNLFSKQRDVLIFELDQRNRQCMITLMGMKQM